MIRVGVIGVGAMGRHHARVYSDLPDVDLVGIADVDVDLANSVAGLYHTQAFAGFESLLRQELDAVSVAVPSSLHNEVAVAAAGAGIHVLVEKPIADTLESAQDIIKAAEKNNVKLMVGHIERYNPAVTTLRKAAQGKKLIFLEITRVGPFPPRVKDIGIVIDLGVHDIDLVRYLTCSEYERVECLVANNTSGKEDAAIFLFKMRNGVLGRITTNWLTPFKIREVTLATSERFVRGDLLAKRVIEYSQYCEDGSYSTKELAVPFVEPLKAELQAFLQSVVADEPPPITGEDGLIAVKIALSVLGKESEAT